MQIKVKSELYKLGSYLTAYEAIQEGLGKRVEIRVLSQEVVANSDEVQRFLAEIKTLALLDHPSILRVLDSGYQGTKLYYVTSLKDGKSLASLLGSGDLKLDLQQKTRMFHELAGAVSYMHARGVIHRGLDAHSVYYNDENRHAYISQFNFAKNLNIKDLTGAGVGHVLTLPTTPEMMLGIKDESKVDMYLLGSLMYRVYAGCPPYDPKSLRALIKDKEATVEPVVLVEKGVELPEFLEETMRRSVAIRPDERFESDDAFCVSLQECIDQIMLSSWSARKSRRTGRTPSSDDLTNPLDRSGESDAPADSSGAAPLLSTGATPAVTGSIAVSPSGPAQSPLVLILIGILIVAFGAAGFYFVNQ